MSDALSIEWVEELPPAQLVRFDDAEKRAVVRRLQEKPGKWAKIGKPSSNSSRVKGWQKLGLEAASRSTGDKDERGRTLYQLYVRAPEGSPVRLTDHATEQQEREDDRQRAARNAAHPVEAAKAALLAKPDNLDAVQARQAGSKPAGNDLGEILGVKIPPHLDGRTRPRRVTGETDAAYRMRIERWVRGVPPGGKRP